MRCANSNISTVDFRLCEPTCRTKRLRTHYAATPTHGRDSPIWLEAGAVIHKGTAPRDSSGEAVSRRFREVEAVRGAGANSPFRVTWGGGNWSAKVVTKSAFCSASPFDERS